MEDKESELKKEYNKVHERYTEVRVFLFIILCIKIEERLTVIVIF